MEIKKKFSSRCNDFMPSPIRAMAKYLNAPEIISFAGGAPNPETFPVKDICQLMELIAEKFPKQAFQYNITSGLPELRNAILKYLSSQRGLDGVEGRSGPYKTANVLITSGSQQALDLISRVLINPGDHVAVELPSYIGALYAMKASGACFSGIRQHADGIDLDDLERAAQKDHIKFLYTISNFQNPSAVIISREKKRAIYELAEKYDFLIVEDDPYGELYFDFINRDDIEPIKTYDHSDRVIYLSSFSKTAMPGLRMAYIVAPEDLIKQVDVLKQSADLCSSVLDQHLIYLYMESGKFVTHLDDVRAFYQERAAVLDRALRQSFTNTNIEKVKGGMFYFVHLNTDKDLEPMVIECIEKCKVAFLCGKPFFVNGTGNNTIRLTFAKEGDARIEEGVGRLAAFLREKGVL